MKKAFSLLELIVVISLVLLVLTFTNIKFEDNSLDKLSKRLVIYLKQTRYQSLIENQNSEKDHLWHKKRWTLKFFRCRKSVGGIYYVIYSDKNRKGKPNLNESMNDPLTNKKIYSTNMCEYSSKTSKYVLLTKEFGVEKIDISCNKTNSLGQISFGNDGRVYSKLSPYEDDHFEYEIKDKCTITFKVPKKGSRKIIIEGKTGYIYIKK